MRALLALLALLLQAVLCGGIAAAADQAPVKELDPVHVNAMRDPEVRKYTTVLAGLDAFDKYHELAPKVDVLNFRLTARKKDEAAAPLAIKLVGDDGFNLPVPIDAGGRFTVPRSEAAEDARSELELNRKRGLYRAGPDIRTPGLPASQRRLGDLRLECKVTVAMAKEEIGLFWTMTINTLLLTSDWCAYFNEKHKARFGFRGDGEVTAAVLREGERSLILESKGSSFEVPLGSPDWSDEAVIELTYAAPTETVGETPQTVL
jgi:hypothetical protein